MPSDDGDFCRVCRCEGTPSQPLFYPCMCTGSIKYVHQECLVQWLQYSKRQTCELCNHRFTFKPVYAPHTPSVVPLPVLFFGLLTAFRNVVVRFFHLLAVVISWLFVVPLTVCRIYRCFFSGNLIGLLSLPLDILSTEHVIQDCIQGFLIVLVALTALFGCVWLREQLVIGGEPDWLTDGEVAAEEEREGEEVEAEGAGEAAAPNQVVATADPVPAAAAPINSADDQANPPDGEEGETQGLALPLQPPPQQEQPAVGGAAVPPGGNNEPDFDAAAAMPPLTLERIFGLDGTMTFLEHVLWIIVLNILFILFFASFPFYTGRTVISALGIKTSPLTPPIELILFSFIGYVVMATLLIISHYVFKAIGLPRSASYYAGLCYIYIKVPIIAFVELGIFTAFCGLWIDACSLGMFNASVAQRLRAFNYAPVVFSFIHWTMGLMYLFYVSSLFIIIRDVIRPGVLWFLPDFTDPDYRPVQDMISLPVTTYIQRLVVNLSLTGIIVILSIWLPTLITQKLLPGFLPFQMSLAYDSPVDYSVEIIILQIVMPFLLDGQFKVFLSAVLRNWCVGAAWMLGLRSYLLGDVVFKPNDEIVMADGRRVLASALSRSTSGSTDGGDSASHASGNGGDGGEAENAAVPPPPPPMGGYAPYARPRFFVVRLFGLLVLLVASLVLISLAVLVVPVALGRLMLGHMGLSQTPHHDALTLLVGVCSLMGWAKTLLCLPMVLQTLRNVWFILVDRAAHLTTWEGWRWLSEWTLGIGEWLRGHSFAPLWVRREAMALMLPPLANAPINGDDADAAALHRKQVLRELLLTLSVPLRLALLSSLLLVILPASLGLLINLVVFIPVWVGPEKTLAIGFSESWIFGVMHLKVWMLILLVGPRWQVRDRLEEIHDELLHNWPTIRVFRIIRLSLPLFAIIGISLSFPFLLAYYLGPRLNIQPEVAFRYVYPLLFGLVLLGVLVYWQMRQCIKLYEQIKDAEYLIGRRLVNYGDVDSAGTPTSGTSAEMGTQTDIGMSNENIPVAT
ncbi:E3 ubiquitin-protein ligase MARCHF6 [Taenia crassiceps]|uniref:RING-type E3 ubiquitin transferase n=1 Tax=Taenia crassiceps TaxID=6207 RepID=A0ABR4Q942_9CEST